MYSIWVITGQRVGKGRKEGPKEKEFLKGMWVFENDQCSSSLELMYMS